MTLLVLQPRKKGVSQVLGEHVPSVGTRRVGWHILLTSAGDVPTILGPSHVLPIPCAVIRIDSHKNIIGK